MAEDAPRYEFVREETTAIGGSNLRCSVVRLQDSQLTTTTTVWVEQDGFRVRRVVTEQEPVQSNGYVRQVRTLEFPVANIGEPVPDSTFIFIPPVGAREIVTFAGPH